jgi:histone H3/H4
MLTELLYSKRPFMQLIKGISRDSNVVGNDPAYHWQTAAIRAIQEMAEAFLVREFESKFFYLWTKHFHKLIVNLVTLMCSIHAKCVTITPSNIELADSLHVMMCGKSSNKKAYAAYTAQTSNAIDFN